MGIMDNEGHDPMGFGNMRSALPMQARPTDSLVALLRSWALGNDGGHCSIMADAADEIERLRAAQDQIRGFAKVMDENNWRDLKLHIERQCAVEQDASK